VGGEVGLDVGADVVGLGRLVQGRGQAHGVVEQPDRVRERVAEEARDAQGDVDARAAQLLGGDGLQTGHAAGGVVPDRADAEQGERLGHIVPGRAHRAGTPQRQPHGRRPFAVVGAVALQQGVREGLAGLPGEA
jgi:hypothetical protein